jgi:hypothetical protein
MSEFTKDLQTGLHPYKERALEVWAFLKAFAKHPVRQMQNLPNWDWSTLIAFYTLLAAVSGLLSGIISTKISQIIAGLILFPISANFGAAVLSGFFYYVFLFGFHHEVPIKKIATAVTASMIPFFILYAVSGLLEPAKLLGVASAGALLVIGLSESTAIPRRRIFQIVLGLFVLYFVFWAVNMATWRSENKRYKDLATPDSYKQLEKEFSK